MLVADRVTGEEEVPQGAVAVLTPDAPDVLAHVSVRARNMKVLFAVCHEDAPLKEIRTLAGKVHISVPASGKISLPRYCKCTQMWLHHNAANLPLCIPCVSCLSLYSICLTSNISVLMKDMCHQLQSLTSNK